MSEYKRGWLFTFVFYSLGLGFYLFTERESIASGEWVMAAFGLIVPALLLAYVLNALVEISKRISARKRMQPEGKWTIAARARGCYCGVWDKEPEAYRKLGYAPESVISHHSALTPASRMILPYLSSSLRR